MNGPFDARSQQIAIFVGTLPADILEALEASDTTEIQINPDSRVFWQRFGLSQAELGQINSSAALAIVHAAAGLAGQFVNESRPLFSTELPWKDLRFSATVPPISAAAAICMRKPNPVRKTLDDYVADGFLAPRHRDAIRDAIVDRKNILVVAGTEIGKTTFQNAILRESTMVADRTAIIEDRRELRFEGANYLPLRTSNYPLDVSAAHLVKQSMTMTPVRIHVGEIRDGETCFAWLDAGKTGHPGSMAGIHGNSAAEGLQRCENLLRQVMTHPDRHLIATSANLIVVLRRGEDRKPRIMEVVRVQGLRTDGTYDLERVAA